MTTLTYSELQNLLQVSPHHLLLDCRTLEYWLWETIPNSRNIRLKDLPEKAAKELQDKHTPIVVFADAQGTELAKIGCDLLKELNYTAVYYFEGGIDTWKHHSGTPFRSPFRIGERSMRLPAQRFYGEEVSSYLITTDEYLVLVDGPLTLSESNEDFILSFNKPIRVLLTHGGVGGGTSEILQTLYQAEIFLHMSDKESEWLTCTPSVLFESEFAISDDLTVITTPGNSPGSVVLYDSKDKVLYCGGLLVTLPSQDIKIPEGEEVDKECVTKSLEKLQFLPISTIAPFRGPVIHSPSSRPEGSNGSLIHRVLKEYLPQRSKPE